jgi:hypothetical protein
MIAPLVLLLTKGFQAEHYTYARISILSGLFYPGTHIEAARNSPALIPKSGVEAK